MQTEQLVSGATFQQLCARVSNWGRWGDDDQRGTVNLLTAERIKDALSAVVDGDIHALGVALGSPGPQIGNPRRFDPLHYLITLPTENIREGAVGAADDVLMLPLQAGTQWDSLAHIAHEGRLYGGRPATSVTAGEGALAGAITTVSSSVAGRAVLVDVARFRGVDYLKPGYAIGSDELSDVLESQGSPVREGDILLVRTGFLGHCRDADWHEFAGEAPGLHVSTLDFISEHGLAAVASDTSAIEVKPFSVERQTLPFHVVAIVYMGLLLGEIFDLDALASACAADGRYEGFLTAPPLPVTGGIGSPINPYFIR